MKKAGKALIGLAAVGVLGIFVVMRLLKPEEPIEAVPDPAVSIQTPTLGTIELATELTGAVEPADVVYVVPMGSGEVLEVYAKMGDTVEKDQPLFKIDNKQLDAAKITLDTTKVSLDDATASLNRMKALYESGDISAQAYEQTVNGVEMARLQYESAKLNYDVQMDCTVVTAPIAGLLEKFDVEVHDMSAAGNVAAVISGAGSKSLSFSVTERVVNGLSVGDMLEAEKNGMKYEGVITEIGTMVDPASGLFKVKATLDGADGLATGTMVKLYVTAQKAENVMTVPVDCVSYSAGRAYVYTYDAEASAAKKVYVEDGLIDSEKVEILSGLSMEDNVIVTWSKELYDGATVKLSEADGVSRGTNGAAEAAAVTK